MHKKKKPSGLHASSRKPTKKVCDENEQRKKRCVCKNVFNGRKWFISCMRGTGEMDCNEMWVNDS